MGYLKSINASEIIETMNIEQRKLVTVLVEQIEEYADNDAIVGKKYCLEEDTNTLSRLLQLRRNSYPCPDDQAYQCSKCGEATGRGYDSGLCATCLDEH
ncbi:MAG: hypothetical protein HRT88_11980 [Lentisphaeraceae bacterium]|nr:hypothetical protein [Lentisphaeraceae bacterium]